MNDCLVAGEDGIQAIPVIEDASAEALNLFLHPMNGYVTRLLVLQICSIKVAMLLWELGEQVVHGSRSKQHDAQKLGFVRSLFKQQVLRRGN